MPIGANVLSVGVQGDNIVLWAMVDSGAKECNRCFAVFGTGHEIDADLPACNFVGTAQFPAEQGGLVFHVFEIPS